MRRQMVRESKGGSRELEQCEEKAKPRSLDLGIVEMVAVRAVVMIDTSSASPSS